MLGHSPCAGPAGRREAGRNCLARSLAPAALAEGPGQGGRRAGARGSTQPAEPLSGAGWGRFLTERAGSSIYCVRERGEEDQEEGAEKQVPGAELEVRAASLPLV